MSLGKNKLDNSKGLWCSSELPISHACAHTERYIGHPPWAKILSVSSPSRPPLHTMNHSGEKGNGSLHYVNDIVHSLFYKLSRSSSCCVPPPLTWYMRFRRENENLDGSLPVVISGKRGQLVNCIKGTDFESVIFPLTVKSAAAFCLLPQNDGF